MASTVLTTTYQEVASGKKSFTADSTACAVTHTIEARINSIDEEKLTAKIDVRTYVKGTKNQFSSTDNVQYIRIDQETKKIGYSIGTIKNGTIRKTAEVTYTVNYNEDGIYQDVIIRAVSNIYGNVNVEAEGYITLPELNIANARIGINSEVVKGMFRFGYNQNVTKPDVYIGDANGKPLKGV